MFTRDLSLKMGCDKTEVSRTFTWRNNCSHPSSSASHSPLKYESPEDHILSKAREVIMNLKRALVSGFQLHSAENLHANQIYTFWDVNVIPQCSLKRYFVVKNSIGMKWKPSSPRSEHHTQQCFDSFTLWAHKSHWVCRSGLISAMLSSCTWFGKLENIMLPHLAGWFRANINICLLIWDMYVFFSRNCPQCYSLIDVLVSKRRHN